MFLDTLRLQNNETGEVFRTVQFHEGTNLVVDAQDSDAHNKVGKTTFLKLIDVLMGAKDKKNIYHDDETNSDALDLANFIEDNRVCASLTMKRSLSEREAAVCVEVDLFSRGSYRIDGERVSQKEYRVQLNNLLFNNEANIPTFRQLINSFVRVSMTGDDDSFLKCIPNASISIYRSVYNYLFDIANPALDKMLGEAEAEKRRVEEAKKQYVRLNSAGKSLDEQRQIMVAAQRDLDVVTRHLNDMVDADDFARNRDHIAEIRNEYTHLMDAIAQVDYRSYRNEEALREAYSDYENSPDPSLSKRFYDEVKQLIPSVLRTYDDLVKFNQKLSANKIQYYEGLQVSLSGEKEALQARLASFIQENQKYMSIVEDDDLSKYEELSRRRDHLLQEIAKIQEAIGATEQFEKKLKSLKAQIKDLKKGDKNIEYQATMNKYNSIFTDIAQSINGERPVLVYFPQSKDFPVAIRELAGTSTGTRKSLIAAYDLAYQIYAQEIGKPVPRFVVHDVLENIEGDNLRTIFAVANQSGAQYIVAVLKEKLDSSGIDDESYNRYLTVTLSADDRLFEGQTRVGSAEDTAVRASAQRERSEKHDKKAAEKSHLSEQLKKGIAKKKRPKKRPKKLLPA